MPRPHLSRCFLFRCVKVCTDLLLLLLFGGRLVCEWGWVAGHARKHTRHNSSC